MQNKINQISSHNKDNVPNSDSEKKGFFEFNLLVCDFYEGKIECIFNNFDLFNFWMKFIEQIAEYYRNDDGLN